MRRIRDYWVKKLLFPKNVLIDEPGVIVNCVMRKYGGARSKQRMVFFFEDIIVGLQKETEITLGYDDACKMWYEIGKEVGTRYLLLSHIEKMPHFLFGAVLEHIFSGFCGGGQSFAEKFIFDIKNLEFFFEGSNSILCRKTANGNFSAGVISGVISFIVGKNIEATTSCICPNACRISASPNNEERYILNKSNLLPDFNYSKFNFFTNVLSNKSIYSFKDMIRFNKIRLIQDKWVIEKSFLVPGEVGMIGIINDAFVRRGIGKVFDSTVIKEAEALAKKILMKQDIDFNFKKITTLFSVLGMGIIQYFRSGDKLEISIKFPPYSKYGFNYIIFLLNGFINIAMNKKMRLSNKKFDGYNLLLSFL